MENFIYWIAAALIAFYLSLEKKKKTGLIFGDPEQPASPANRLSVPNNVGRWISPVKAAVSRYGRRIPNYTYIMGILWTESGGTFEPPGSAGEIGLMQLKQIAVDDVRLNGYGSFTDWRTNEITNIEAGTAFLDLQLKRTGGNIREALRAYNQGFQGKDASARQAAAADVYADKVLSRSKNFN